jgi:hypothetical protein
VTQRNYRDFRFGAEFIVDTSTSSGNYKHVVAA